MIFNLHNSHIAVLTVLSSVIQIKKKLPSFPAEEKSVSDFTSEDKEIEYSPVTLAFTYDIPKGRLISEKKSLWLKSLKSKRYQIYPKVGKLSEIKPPLIVHRIF